MNFNTQVDCKCKLTIPKWNCWFHSGRFLGFLWFWSEDCICLLCKSISCAFVEHFTKPSLAESSELSVLLCSKLESEELWSSSEEESGWIFLCENHQFWIEMLVKYLCLSKLWCSTLLSVWFLLFCFCLLLFDLLFYLLFCLV